MRQQFSVVLIVFLVVSSVMVSAQDTVLPEPRVVPGDFLYPFKIAGENLREGFTFNKVSKASLRLQHAQERLAEIQKLLSLKRDVLVEKARTRYDADSKLAEDTVNGLSDDERVKYAGEISTFSSLHGKNVEVLNRVIARFEKDDNPNNDNAITSLKDNVQRAMIKQVEIQNVEESARNITKSRVPQGKAKGYY